VNKRVTFNNVKQESCAVAGNTRDAAVNFHPYGGCRQQTSVKATVLDLIELEITPFDPPPPNNSPCASRGKNGHWKTE